jgi:Domain of unknown function (DUF4263)
VAFWNAYYAAMAPVVARHPDLQAELPAWLISPNTLHVHLARDGVVIIHEPSDQPVANLRADDRSLNEMLPDVAGGFMQPPFPAGGHTVISGAGLRATEVGTGRVLAESALERFEVVGYRELWHWDERWAPTLARADFETSARGLVAGQFVPFVSSAEQALRAAADELERLLATGPSEERVQTFLQQSPQVLAPTHANMLPKPRLGSDFVPDFAFEDHELQWTLVELEPSTLPLFTKAGDPTRHLSHAVRQFSDWRNWVNSHRSYASETLPRVGDVRGLVVIGRSESPAILERLRQFESVYQDLRVLTWDELVASARRQAQNIREIVVGVGDSPGQDPAGEAQTEAVPPSAGAPPTAPAGTGPAPTASPARGSPPTPGA